MIIGLTPVGLRLDKAIPLNAGSFTQAGFYAQAYAVAKIKIINEAELPLKNMIGELVNEEA